MRHIRWLIPLLLFFSSQGSAQRHPDSLYFVYPDTLLNLEQILFFVEEETNIYFSYNPELLDLSGTVDIPAGMYRLMEFVNMISDRDEIKYTIIDNQIVFHRFNESPAKILRTEDTQTTIRAVRGQVLGASDRKPLEFATIWIPASWEGTVANAEGMFILNFPQSGNVDTIAVSCMGYETRMFPLESLNDSLNLIYLADAIIPIQEVVIRRTDPASLIRQAILRIPDNYFRNSVIERAFYRESILTDNRYIGISEAVLDIYKPGVNSHAMEQVKVLRGRNNKDLQEADTLMIKLQAGLRTSFLLDLTMNLPDFLDPEQFQMYDYMMSDIIIMQGKSAYAIDFTQDISTRPPHYQGRIYIDLETMAFRGLDFEISPQTITKATSSMVLRKPRHLKVRPLSASYKVRYKQDRGKFYLSLIQAENRFRIRERKKIFGAEIMASSEMAITDLQTENVRRFRARETTNTSDVFAELLGGFDPAFWGPYNYIIPEESLDDALERISRLMDTRTGTDRP